MTWGDHVHGGRSALLADAGGRHDGSGGPVGAEGGTKA